MKASAATSATCSSSVACARGLGSTKGRNRGEIQSCMVTMLTMPAAA